MSFELRHDKNTRTYKQTNRIPQCLRSLYDLWVLLSNSTEWQHYDAQRTRRYFGYERCALMIYSTDTCHREMGGAFKNKPTGGENRHVWHETRPSAAQRTWKASIGNEPYIGKLSLICWPRIGQHATTARREASERLSPAPVHASRAWYQR